MLSRVVRSGILSGLVAMGLCIPGSGAQAASIDVTPGAVDRELNANCSIVEAIEAANGDVSVDLCAAGDGDDIIHIGSATYTLVEAVDDYGGAIGLPRIASAITIVGDGAVIERESQVAFRLFSVRDGAMLGLEHMTLKNGEATAAGDFASSGGAIFVKNGALSLSDVRLTDHSAGSTGAALRSIDGEIEVDGCEFRYNVAGVHGGGISAAGGTLGVSQTSFSDNFAASQGGAIYARGCSLTLCAATLTDNTAGVAGGGLTVDEGAAWIDACTISHNHAGGKGGGLRVQGVDTSGSEVTVFDSTLADNVAETDGGGVSIIRSYLLLEKSTVSGNRTGYADSVEKCPGGPDGRGGGFNIDTGTTARLVNSTVSGNEARCYGGGIYLDALQDLPQVNTFLEILDCTITNNMAIAGPEANGGGIWQNPKAQLTHTNTINALNDPCDCVHTESIIKVDGGGNWFGDENCNGTGQGDPLIHPLAYNGGPTRTHALQRNSPARDAITEPTCPITDQRGRRRNDGACDIGAFEIVRVPVPFGVLRLLLLGDEAQGLLE